MRAQELLTLRHPSDLQPAACAWLPAGSGLHHCAKTVLVDTELCHLLLEQVGWTERNGGGGDVNRSEVVTLKCHMDGLRGESGRYSTRRGDAPRR